MELGLLGLLHSIKVGVEDTEWVKIWLYGRISVRVEVRATGRVSVGVRATGTVNVKII